MARIRIIACDGHPGEALRPAVGRFGIQRADQPVAWVDACEECLERAAATLTISVTPSANGTGKKRFTDEELEPVKVASLRALKKLGPVTATRIAAETGYNYSATLRALWQMKKEVRHTGTRNMTRWEVRR